MEMSVAGSHLCPLNASPIQTTTVAEPKPAVLKDQRRFFLFYYHYKWHILYFLFVLLSFKVIDSATSPQFTALNKKVAENELGMSHSEVNMTLLINFSHRRFFIKYRNKWQAVGCNATNFLGLLYYRCTYNLCLISCIKLLLLLLPTWELGNMQLGI